MINKKGSAVLVFLVASILIVSSGLIVTYGVGKSNSENDVSGTGLVLLDREQDTLSNLDFLDDEREDDSENFVRQDIVKSSKSKNSKKSNSGSSGGSSSGGSDSGDVVNDENEDLGISSSRDSNSSLNDSAMDSIVVQSFLNGVCKDESIETDEGPGGTYCKYEDYEQCFDYKTKSTVIAYDCTFFSCFEVDRGTDYCIDSETLNEAWLNCGVTPVTPDYLDWEEKDCNDFDNKHDWEYYCTSTQVRKKRYFYNYGCSSGACKVVSSGWVDDTLVSKEGYSNYCTKRKEHECSLCGHGDYECDWSSECYGSLECMGPGVLLCSIKNCGCCKSGESWDITRDECCECDDATDPCCDGCHYESSSKVCDYHYGSYYYSCNEGDCLGDDVYKKDKKRYCSGTSSSCTGDKVWNNPIVYDYCSTFSSEFCNADNAGWSAFSCSTAQCTSGVCCDTDCGDYTFKSSISACAARMDYGCPWGTDLGDNVGERSVQRYCSGSSSLCNGEEIFGTWSLKEDCNTKEYCENGACKSIVCSSDSDCSSDYWYGKECKYNDVYGTFVDYNCKNPGTKQSECASQSTYKKKEECGTSGYTGEDYCYDNDVYRDYVSRGCSNGYCDSNTEKIKQNECGDEGCLEGSCIGCISHDYSQCYDNDVYWFDSCDNREEIKQECGDAGCLGESCIICTSHAYAQCFDNDVYWFDSCDNREEIKQECGEDYCEDWQDDYCADGDVYHKRICYDKGCSTGSCDDTSTMEEQKVQDCDYGYTNGECKKPDLVVENFYYNDGAFKFRIKNIGNAIADPVYWVIDTDFSNEFFERTKSVILAPGKSTLGGFLWTYSQSGTYNPKVIVDFGNLVDESDETNNEKSISVTV